jgi:isopentenyl phosphate kinase
VRWVWHGGGQFGHLRVVRSLMARQKAADKAALKIFCAPRNSLLLV